MTNEPCLNCTCHNRMLMCYLRVCPFTKPIGEECTVEKREDQCCPIITCPEGKSTHCLHVTPEITITVLDLHLLLLSPRWTSWLFLVHRRGKSRQVWLPNGQQVLRWGRPGAIEPKEAMRAVLLHPECHILRHARVYSARRWLPTNLQQGSVLSRPLRMR